MQFQNRIIPAISFVAVSSIFVLCFESTNIRAQSKTDESSSSTAYRLTVVDSAGRPIPEARLSPATFDVDYSLDHALDPQAPLAIGDEQGVIQWCPAKHHWVFDVWIQQKGFLSKRLENIDKDQEIRLDQALRIDGTVVDENGNAVPNAIVSTTTRRLIAKPPRYPVPTDSQGRFSISTIQQFPTCLRAVTEDGKCGKLDNVTAEQNPVIQLEPPREVEFRVVDYRGAHLGNAEIELVAWDESQAIQWKTNTNLEGKASWKSAPKGNLYFVITKDGYRTQWVSTSADKGAITAELQPALNIRAKVLDAETGKPISRFFLHPVYTRSSGFYHKSETDELFLLDHTKLSRALGGWTMEQESFHFHSTICHDSFQLLVVAPGYEIARLDDSLRTMHTEQTVLLSKIRNWSDKEKLQSNFAQIVNPDGKPASYANVQIINTLGASTSFDDIRFQSQRAMYDKGNVNLANIPRRNLVFDHVDGNGYFHVPETTQTGTSFLFWNATGGAIVSAAQLEPGAAIMLEPFARIRIRKDTNNRIQRKRVSLRALIPTNVFTFDPALEQEDSSVVTYKVIPFQVRVAVADSHQPTPLDSIVVQARSGESIDVTLDESSKLRGTLSLDGLIPVTHFGFGIPIRREINRNVEIEIQLESTESKKSDIVYRGKVRPLGFFEIRNIPKGIYRLKVLPIELPSSDDDATVTEYVLQLRTPHEAIEIRENEVKDLGELKLHIGD